MIAKEEISAAGVFPPEGCPDLDINKLVKELEKREIHIMEISPTDQTEKQILSS
jgi:hypothetical protein